MNTTNPFDFSQAFAKFNTTDYAKQFKDALNIDFDGILQAQEKNIELLVNTNKAIAEGSRSLAGRQIAMLQEAMNEAVKTAQELTVSGKPEDVVKKQTEVVQQACETAINNFKEISEMAKNLQDEVTEKINVRVSESIQEIKEKLAKVK